MQIKVKSVDRELPVEQHYLAQGQQPVYVISGFEKDSKDLTEKSSEKALES